MLIWIRNVNKLNFTFIVISQFRTNLNLNSRINSVIHFQNLQPKFGILLKHKVLIFTFYASFYENLCMWNLTENSQAITHKNLKANCKINAKYYAFKSTIESDKFWSRYYLLIQQSVPNFSALKLKCFIEFGNKSHENTWKSEELKAV